MSSGLVFGQIWSIILLITTLIFYRQYASHKRIDFRHGWLAILLIACIARLVPNFIISNGATYDINSYWIVGRLVLRGRDVYTSVAAIDRHPYLPLMMYWMAFSRNLATRFDLEFVKIVRLLPIFADIFIALMIYWVLRKSSDARIALLSGLLYAVNPIPVYVSAYHGQFDAIPALLLLISLYLLENSATLSGIFLGLGILVKSWPVLALPSLFVHIKPWSKRRLFLAFVILVPLLGVITYSSLFHANPMVVIRNALQYNLGYGVWGYTYLLRLSSIVFPTLSDLYEFMQSYSRIITIAGLALAWLFHARKETPENSLVTILITFLVITHAFSIQYLIWVIPFALLAFDIQWLMRYTIIAFIYMFIAYNFLILEPHITRLLPLPQGDLFIIMPIGLMVWLVCIGWFISRLRGPQNHHAHPNKSGCIYGEITTG